VMQASSCSCALGWLDNTQKYAVTGECIARSHALSRFSTAAAE
jgi:hypothetical protein